MSRNSSAFNTGAPTVWKLTFQKRKVSLYSRVRKPVNGDSGAIGSMRDTSGEAGADVGPDMGADMDERSGTVHHLDEDAFEIGLAELHLGHARSGFTQAGEQGLDVGIAVETEIDPAPLPGHATDLDTTRRICEANAQAVRRKTAQEGLGGIERHHLARLEHGDAPAQGLGLFQVV